jgi:hypothetical protein
VKKRSDTLTEEEIANIPNDNNSDSDFVSKSSPSNYSLEDNEEKLIEYQMIQFH